MLNRLKALGVGVAVFSGVVSLWIPDVDPAAKRPQCDPYGPVLVSTDSEAKEKKKCEPACVSPQVCVDGTCCLPACFPASYTPPSFEARLREPHSALAGTWTSETLEMQ